MCKTDYGEIGIILRGKVVTIKEFVAFFEFIPGKDGLVHISELANFRVKQTEDIVKLGDEIWVKCLGVDEKGRVKLSRKAAMAERDQEMGGGETPRANGGGQHDDEPRDDERGPRGDRGGENRRGGEREHGDEGMPVLIAR